MTARRLLACAVGGMAVLCVSAPAAAAKSGIEVSAVWVAGAAGGAGSRDGGVAVSAFGGDDAAGPQRLCLQESTAAGWHTLACGRVELGTGGRIRFAVPAAGPRARFRAVLQRVPRLPGRGPQADLTSAPVAPVAPRGPSTRGVRSARGALSAASRPDQSWQANSRSVVSLSSADNGIDTASVVRSK